MSATPLPRACAARYAPERELASGGFATVWLARQVGLDRPVVVKLLHAEILESPALVERFLNEARITAALSHPHIVILIDHGVDDGVPWIVYEYLPRGTLAGAIARGPLPWREAAVCVAQVAGALQLAHSRGVLHRDVKPANVLEAAPGAWKVVDFGVAKWAEGATVRTREGLVVGSPAYLAPEQLLGAPATPQTDIYALGLVLFQALAGQLPPRGSGIAGGMSVALAQLAQESGRALPPEPVLGILDAALALDPTRRMQTAAELAEALEELLGAPSGVLARPRAARAEPARGAGGATPRTAVGAVARPMRGRGSRKRVAGIALAVAVLGSGALLAVRGLRAPPRDEAWSTLPDAATGAGDARVGPGAGDAGAARMADDGLRVALDRYQATPVAERRALWAWRGAQGGLAEALRTAIAGSGAPADHAKLERLAAWLRGLESSERENPLYWACRGLAAGTGAPGRDLTDVEPRTLKGLHDAYTGLYLALDAGARREEVSECALLVTERARSWRPKNPLFDEEWSCWRLFHLHHAREVATGTPAELARRMDERMGELHAALGLPPADAPAGAVAAPLGIEVPGASPALADFRRLAADPARALGELAPLELALALRAGKAALEGRGAALARVDRWVDDLMPWGAPRVEYWLMRMSWLTEQDRTPEARSAYLRGMDRWFHLPAPRDTAPARALHERFLETFLARLVSAETVGTHGDFGIAMDFATQVESSLRGTREVEESMTSLQRTAACAHLELIAGAPEPATAARRSWVKARLYRATLVSRSTCAWLLGPAHDRAERAMAEWGNTLSAERAQAMRAELGRLQALRKQLPR